MRKYYKLTNDSIQHNGKTLYRIQALLDLPELVVEFGDLGGYVESYENLSENAWVYDDACVYGNAKVFGNAKICGQAEIFENAMIYENARISGKSKISGDMVICGNTVITGNVKMSDSNTIRGSKIFHNQI